MVAVQELAQVREMLLLRVVQVAVVQTLMQELLLAVALELAGKVMLAQML
jgi:hypothetical protein